MKILEINEIRQHRLIEHKPCVYFLFKNGSLVYIGKTKTLLTRISYHSSSGKDFDEYFFYYPEDYSSSEILHIKHYRPLYNKTYTKIREYGPKIKFREPIESIDLHEIIKSARISKGLTQKQLANKMGIKYQGVTRIESANSNPCINTLNKVAEALELTLCVEFVPE